MYLAAFYIRFQLPHNSWALDQFGKLGMTLFEYMMGVYCVKLGVFDKIQKAVRRLPIIALNVLLLLVVFAAVYARAKIIPSVVFAPISGFLFLTAFWLWNKPRFVEKSLLFVGKHSTNIWLVHMFFYASIFDKLVFVARYPIAILAFMLLLTIASSVIIHLIHDPISKKIDTLISE